MHAQQWDTQQHTRKLVRHTAEHMHTSGTDYACTVVGQAVKGMCSSRSGCSTHANLWDRLQDTHTHTHTYISVLDSRMCTQYYSIPYFYKVLHRFSYSSYTKAKAREEICDHAKTFHSLPSPEGIALKYTLCFKKHVHTEL